MTPDDASQPGRVIVTGAEGFVGGWLLRCLRQRVPAGWELFGLVRHEAGAGQDGIERIAVDISDREAVNDVVARIRPTCVVHLAAVAAVAEAQRDPAHTWAVNLGGTLNLGDALLRHAGGARFVHVGTSEAYGGTFNGWAGKPLDETALLDPTSSYASSKAAADLLVGQMARDGLRAIRFRPFSHTGPGQSEQFVVPAFAGQIARIERGLQDPVLQVGNLDAERDFLDVRDVVDAYVRAVLMPGDLEPGLIVNLASGEPRAIRGILDELLARARVPISVQLDPSRLRPNDTPRAIGNAQRARAVLGWEPATPWGTTLDDVLEGFRAEGD